MARIISARRTIKRRIQEPMNWHEYNTDKTYVVVRHGGGGVMGSPYYEINVVFESHDESECILKSARLNKLDDEYYYHHYLNLNSEVGKIQKAKSQQWMKENEHLFKNKLDEDRENCKISGESSSKVVFTDKGWKYITNL